MPNITTHPKGTHAKRPRAAREIPGVRNAHGKGNPMMAVNRIHRATGLPVQDASDEVCVVITDEETRSDPGDPQKCALAVGWREQSGATFVEVRRTMAYVCVDGSTMLRFVYSKATQILVGAFDITGRFPPGEYWFVPPAPSSRLGAGKSRPAKKKKPERGRREAAILGGFRPTGNALTTRAD